MLRFRFQISVAAFQFFVLTGIVQDIQIDIPVIIGFRLHTQTGVRDAELFADTGYPFRHGLHPFLPYPRHLGENRICLYKRLQLVQRIRSVVVI